MARTFACRLCGRSSASRIGGTPVYCGRCKARSEKEAARILPVRCKECGTEFRTPSRVVRYCSDECRKRSRARYHASYTGRRSAPAGSLRTGRALECRVCGKRFADDGGQGMPKVYCSDACRSEGMRARGREYARRYMSDPEKRAMHAARNRAANAARRHRHRPAGK